MKTPMVSISTQALAELLLEDRVIRDFIKGQGLFQPQGHLKLATMIQERGLSRAMVPEAIEVVSGARERRTLEVARAVPMAQMEHLNRTVMSARVTVLKHNAKAVSLVVEGGKSWDNLVRLQRNVEEAYLAFGPSRLGTDMTRFTENYVTHLLQQLAGRGGKFTISLLLADDVRQGTMLAMQETLDWRANPHLKVVKEMIARFLALTGRKADSISTNTALRVKFLRAQRLMEAQGWFPGRAAQWVEAQCFYYLEHHGDERNLGTETGYLCGPDAVTRYTDYVANLGRVKVEAVGTPMHTIKKKFR